MQKTDEFQKLILAVDDVEMNRDIIKSVFQDIHVVLCAENGEEAMHILNEEDVDIVLLDIQMPVMDGYEVIKMMKASRRLSEIPIIVTTGAIDRSERKAFDLGADDYITQPYDPYVMRKRVENLIDRYDLHKMRHALNEQEKTRDLIDTLGIAYWEWSKDTGYYHSKDYERYAVSEIPEEMIWDGVMPYRFVHPDDVPLMRKYIEQHSSEELRKSVVIRCQMRDGSYRWTEMFSYVEINSEGKLERLASAMRDVDKEWLASFTVEQKNKELNRIIESTSGGVATYKYSNKPEIVSYTDKLLHKLGYTNEDIDSIKEHNAYQFVFNGDRDFVKDKFEQVIQTEQPARFAYRVLKKDKSYKWFRASLYPAGEMEGCPLLYEVMTDIEELNADYEDALNQTNDMVIIADWNSREVLYLNQAAANFGKTDMKELFGKKCSQIAHHSDDCCSYCFKNELTYDELFVREITVENKCFQTKGKRIEWNGREAFVEYVSDITAQHNMTEHAVFERNLMIAATRALFPLCILSNLTKNTFKVLDHSNAIIRKAVTEGNYDDLIAMGTPTVPDQEKDAFLNAFSRESLLKAYAAGVKVIPLIHQQIGDDGMIHWNRTTAVFADELLNGDLYTISFMENFDEQKKKESELKAALQNAQEANVAKTAFLSRVSHDMRTPLNGILGLTTLLKDSAADEKIMPELTELELSGKYLLDLINDTLDVSRIENGKLELHPEVCDGRSLLNSTIGLLKTNAQTKNIHLNICEDNIPFTILYVDTSRIQQVVMNLVGNAIKFSPENGKIDITLSNISVDQHCITDQLVIRDYGIGMSEEFLPHIFEPFSQEDSALTSSQKGTGLGMTISKRIIELMGGSISVESSRGEGTCFTIIMKYDVATDEQIEQWKMNRISINNGLQLCGKRILLCEDHLLNTKIAVKLLKTKGMIAEHAENGAVAVKMFTDSEPGYYDAILMDIRMPVMDGIDATKAIRALPRKDAKSVPIIAMTANAFADDIENTCNAGMNAHLSKPIQTDVLYRTLSDLMNLERGPRKPKILIVDDLEVNRAVIMATLENDFELLEAENGIEALDIMNHTNGIDVVITDIQMPGMDGIELIKQIRKEEKFRRVVIIANTQFGDSNQEERLLSLGANDFIYKPTTPKIVEIRVQNALQRI